MKEMGESVHNGVYAVVGGPNFESVAEVRMLLSLGCGETVAVRHVAAKHWGALVVVWSFPPTILF